MNINKLSNNLFQFNGCGLYVAGQTFSATYNTFNNNSYGVYGTELHGTCDIARNTFADNYHAGCFLSGQGGAETNVVKNEFHATQVFAGEHNNTSSYPSGILLEDHAINMTCNTFNNLYYGVYFPNSYASVDASESSKNSFSDVDYAVFGDIDNGYFNILQGENSFTHSNGQGSRVIINVNNNLTGPTAQHNSSLIDFTDNKMPNIFTWGNVQV